MAGQVRCMQGLPRCHAWSKRGKRGTAGHPGLCQRSTGLQNPSARAAPSCAVATLAMVMINMLPRRDLADEGREEGEEVRS